MVAVRVLGRGFVRGCVRGFVAWICVCCFRGEERGRSRGGGKVDDVVGAMVKMKGRS